MTKIEKYKESVYACARCGTCRSKYDYFDHVARVCPVGEHSPGFEPYFSRGRVAVAQEILEGRTKYSPALAEVLTWCTTCKNCEEKCGATDATGDSKIKTTKITEAMRADIVDLGMAPEAYKRISSRIEKDRNPYSEPKEERAKWAKKLGVPNKADIMYFVGCTSAYRRPEIAKATAKILKAAGVKFGITSDEWCCGSPLFRTGFEKLAEDMAKHNVEVFKGAKTLVTACAGCAKTIINDYPKIVGDLPFQVMHISEFLETLKDEGKLKLKKPIKKKVTYHDPCHMGRELGLYEPPRNVLTAIPGIELNEMVQNRTNAWCCGGGGGFKISNPEAAVEIAGDRLKHAKEVGAKAIVSTCPFCKTNILDAIKAKGSNLEFYDLTELIAKSMGL